jgi:hypothetical protein
MVLLLIAASPMTVDADHTTSDPVDAYATLQPIGDSEVSGSARLKRFFTSNSVWMEMQVSGLAPNTVHSWSILLGSCNSPAGIAFAPDPQKELRANAEGRASVAIKIPSTLSPGNPKTIVVYTRSATHPNGSGPGLACGEINPILSDLSIPLGMDILPVGGSGVSGQAFWTPHLSADNTPSIWQVDIHASSLAPGARHAWRLHELPDDPDVECASPGPIIDTPHPDLRADAQGVASVSTLVLANPVFKRVVVYERDSSDPRGIGAIIACSLDLAGPFHWW